MTKNNSANDIKLLVFDIETTPLKGWTFRPGPQYMTHKSLCKEYRSYDIISISYIDSITNKGIVLDWGYKGETSKEMLKEFDKVITDYQSRGYLIFGKNNNKFDNKHLNTMRFMNGEDPMPTWTKYVDDMEKHFRQNFYFASQSLDYISLSRGLGGKDKMELDDWIKICDSKRAWRMIEAIDGTYEDAKEIVSKIAMITWGKPLNVVLKDGKAALDKMKEYNLKDSEDTLTLFIDAIPYLKNFNNVMATTRKIDESVITGTLACKNCSSINLTRDGIFGNHVHWRCKDCPRTPSGSKRYAGRSLITALGKINSIKV